MSATGDERLRLEWRPFRFPLPTALVTAHGAVVERRGWLLRLSREDGAVGWGEAAPWPDSAEQQLTRRRLAGPRQRAAGLPPQRDREPTSPPECRVHPLDHGASEVPAQVHPQLAAVELAIAELGPSRQRRELESVLPALPACLGFALGLALAELDGLGAVARSDRARGERGAAQDRWAGPWRPAPASAWLLPAGDGALGALETLLAGAEAGQGRGPAVDSPGRLGAGGPGDVVLGVAAAMAPGAAGAAAQPGALPVAGGRGGPQASAPLTLKWKVAAGPDPEERAVLEQLLARLPDGSRLRLDANGGWDRATAQAWAERLASDPRLDWLEQPLAPSDPEGLAALAAVVPVALDESLRLDPGLGHRWPGWQVRRPSLEGDPRPLLRALRSGTPRLMLSTAFETGIGRRFLAHLAALQQDGPTPTAPGLAPGWRPAGALFAPDPALVWAAAADEQ